MQLLHKNCNNQRRLGKEIEMKKPKKKEAKKIQKLAKCPSNEMCNRIHNLFGAAQLPPPLPGCTLHQVRVRIGVCFGIFFIFFFGSLLFFFFIEYCRKRPTNNHLQAAKLHNRPGRISFWVLLLLPLLLLGVIVAIICSKSDTHTQADACTRLHAHAQTAVRLPGRQAGRQAS